MTDCKPIINFQDVCKTYKLYNNPRDRVKELLNPTGKKYHREFQALKNINLEVKRGEILGIVGKNGSGKSTLLKLIAGVLTPNSGTVNIDGAVSALLELGAGFNPDLSGLQNIRFMASISGMPKSDIERKTEEIISFAGVGEHIGQPLKTYSSGMKARLGFAVAISINPEILILDEVLSVGDELFKRKCYSKMEEIFNSGNTVIYVSHDLSSISQYCNRAIMIYGGEILMDGDPKDVVNYYEKLIFSKPRNLRKQLEEIAKLKVNPPKKDLNILQPIREEKKTECLEPYYLEQLKPQSSVIYENHGVEIRDPAITTLNGETVNVLVTKQRYTLSYTVEFAKACKQISFGTTIKSERGLSLAASSVNAAQQLIPALEKGDVVLVEWEFTCNLLPGIYYANNGVSNRVGGDREILARHVDILVFKVITPKNYLSTGIVTLDQSLRCIKDKKVILEID